MKVFSPHEQWQNLTQSLIDKSTAEKIPIKMAIELTPECNLGCKMCYIRLNKDEMKKIGRLLTADEWIEIAKEAADEGTLFITITGGEPLLHPEFEKIYTELSKMGFLIDLFTNGTLVDDHIIELFKKYPPGYISITMYGASEETYEKVCDNGEAYNLVINNIDRIKKELPKLPMTIRTTLTKRSVDDLDSIKKHVNSIGDILSISLATLKPVRGAFRPELDEYRLSYEEARKVTQRYINEYSDGESEYKEVIRQDKSFNCIAGQASCVISWDGRMLPCLVFSSPYAEPAKIGFKSAWKELTLLRQKITVPDRCIGCKWSKYCGTCPAYIQMESGTYKDNEEYNCKGVKQNERICKTNIH